MQVHVAVFDIVLLFLVQNLNNFLFTQQLGIAGFMKLRSVVPGAKMELCVRNSNTFLIVDCSLHKCVFVLRLRNVTIYTSGSGHILNIFFRHTRTLTQTWEVSICCMCNFFVLISTSSFHYFVLYTCVKKIWWSR